MLKVLESIIHSIFMVFAAKDFLRIDDHLYADTFKSPLTKYKLA